MQASGERTINPQMPRTHARDAVESAANVLKALSHPDRLAIIMGLMKNECNVGQIQETLGIPQSTVSQHLRVLRDAGVIRARKEGTRRCYRVISELARRVAKELAG